MAGELGHWTQPNGEKIDLINIQQTKNKFYQDTTLSDDDQLALQIYRKTRLNYSKCSSGAVHISEYYKDLLGEKRYNKMIEIQRRIHND